MGEAWVGPLPKAAGRVRSAASSLRSGPLGQDGAPWLFAGSLALSGGGFALHFVLARQLGPRHYGAFGAFVALLAVLNVPFNSLQVTVTRLLTGVDADQVSLRTVRRRVATAAAAALGGLSIASPMIAGFLHARPFQVMVLGFALTASIVGMVPRSYLMSRRRLRAVGVGLVLSSAARVCVAPLLVAAGLGITGALLGIAAAEIAMAGWFYAVARLPVGMGRREVVLRFGDVALSTTAIVGLWTTIGIDVLMARHVLEPVDAGRYVALSTAASTATFLPGMIAVAIFPTLADLRAPLATRIRALKHALVLVGAIGGSACVALTASPDGLLRALFGAAFTGRSTALGYLALAAAAVALSNVLLYFALANMSRAALLFWVSPPLIAGVALVTRRPEQIALACLVGDATVLAGLALWARRHIAFSRRRRVLETHLVGAGAVDLTIVVPFFNPGPRFEPNLRRLNEVLADEGISYEVIAVSDGSTDGSEAAVAAVGGPVVGLAFGENRGKGAALRAGFERAQGRYVGFIDADGDIDPVMFREFLALARAYEPDIICASKRHPMSQVRYPPLRRLYSVAYQLLVRVLFRVNVRDTQTGIKLIRRPVLVDVLPRLLEKRFALDVELFVVARRMGYTRFFEAPVVIGERFSSTVNVRSVARTLRDTLAIWYRLHLVRSYDDAAPEELELAPLGVAIAPSAA